MEEINPKVILSNGMPITICVCKTCVEYASALVKPSISTHHSNLIAQMLPPPPARPSGMSEDVYLHHTNRALAGKKPRNWGRIILFGVIVFATIAVVFGQGG